MSAKKKAQEFFVLDTGWERVKAASPQAAAEALLLDPDAHVALGDTVYVIPVADTRTFTVAAVVREQKP